MTNQHPIVPPPQLVQQWINDGPPLDQPKYVAHYVATQAAHWAADHELEACCEWLESVYGMYDWSTELRTTRRPKPPSLKEQAIESLTKIENNEATFLDTSIIRRALEQS